MIEPVVGARDDDSELVARIRAGDESAFESLYLAHHEGLWRFAYSHVRSREVAEELVHDLFLSIWGSRANWVVNTRVRAWLYAAVRNLALNHLRHERVVARTLGGGSRGVTGCPARPPFDDGCPGPLTMGAPPMGQLEAVEAGEMDDAFVHAIADLPERRRIAMTLRWKQDMSPLEIARVLGTTPEAVRVLLTRARADLGDLLDRMRR